MTPLTKDQFRTRILKRQERIKEGRRQAKTMATEGYFRTRENAWMAKHANQREKKKTSRDSNLERR